VILVAHGRQAVGVNISKFFFFGFLNTSSTTHSGRRKEEEELKEDKDFYIFPQGETPNCAGNKEQQKRKWRQIDQGQMRGNVGHSS